MNILLLLILKIIVSAAFLAAGVAKLMKAKPLVDQFHDFHLPLEIMYLVAVAEIIGVAVLWYGPLSLWAFASLGCLMLGAIKNHIAAKHSWGSFVPAVVLLALCVAGTSMVYWLHH